MEDINMKCPCCGNEMYLDNHRRIDMHMCYECGYIEGRRLEQPTRRSVTNYERLCAGNLNEMAAIIAKGINADTAVIATWLDSRAIA